MRLIALAAAAVLLLSALTLAQTVRPFPMDLSGEPAPAGVELVFRPDLAADLAELSAVTLTGMPTGVDGSLDLAVERVHLARPGDQLFVDGNPVPGARLDEGVTLWAGTIDGVPDSDVYLAFSPVGVRGWIDGPDGLVHLLARPDDDGSWWTGSSLLLSDTALRELGAEPDFACATEELPPLPGVSPPELVTDAAYQGGTQPLPLLECTVAIETDTQLYKIFGDVAAQQAYLASLVGAISMRYREQLGVILTVPYLGLYTDTDPWTSADDGLTSIDMLYEFEAAWNAGDAPVPANLFHFVSGANLGGGVAYLSTTCWPDYSFGVSGNIAGITPFPIVQGPLNWDFMVVAHEIGHNAGTSHTHNYCPPLDLCAPDGFWGACQTETVCISDGTIMSYCHLCPGGLDNITTYFHPEVVTVIRSFLENFACLTPFDGIFSTDLENGLAGSTGTPQLDVWMASPTQVIADITNARGSIPALLVASPVLLDAPFKGGTLVPAPTAVSPFVTPPLGALQLVLGVSRDQEFPTGIDLWMQAWFLDEGGPFGWSSTSGVAVDLVLSSTPPEPLWIAHPDNGMEYALTTSSGPWAYLGDLAAGYDATLVTIDSTELNDWIVDTFAPLYGGRVYIGLTDEDVEGTFGWVSGEPLVYQNWADGQPNNAYGIGSDHAEIALVDAFPPEGAFVPAGRWNDTMGVGWMTNQALMERPIDD